MMQLQQELEYWLRVIGDRRGGDRRFSDMVRDLQSILESGDERRALIQQADDILGNLWVDLFNTDMVKPGADQAFDYRRQQLRNLVETLN